MTAIRHVWTAEYVDVDIYKEDAAGNLDGGILLEYCFLMNATMTASLETQRRPVTGRMNRKLTGRTFDDCQVTCDFMLWKPAVEIPLTTIFSPRQRLRIKLKLVDPEYSGTSPFENDSFSLHRAMASVWGISKPDSGIITSNATFLGEFADIAH